MTNHACHSVNSVKKPTRSKLAKTFCAAQHLLISIVSCFESNQEIGHAGFAKEMLFARAKNAFGRRNVIEAALAVLTSATQEEPYTSKSSVSHQLFNPSQSITLFLGFLLFSNWWRNRGRHLRNCWRFLFWNCICALDLCNGRCFRCSCWSWCSWCWCS